MTHAAAVCHSLPFPLLVWMLFTDSRAGENWRIPGYQGSSVYHTATPRTQSQPARDFLNPLSSRLNDSQKSQKMSDCK